MRPLLILIFMLLLIGCTNTNTPITKLKGTWSIYEVAWQSNDTLISLEPEQEGLLLVNDDHYSITWSPQKKRNAFKNLSKPNQTEIIEGFQSIVFNSGTYKVDNETFITKAKIAKVPGFEGGIQYYQYALKNDSLELTMYDETYPNGEKPAWYGTWKTRFLLKKLHLN